MREFLRSLQAKYMLIILIAISLIQIGYLFIAIFVMGIAKNMDNQNFSEDITNPDAIEGKWHEEANDLQHISEEQIIQHFAKWKKSYPEASMFWVDENGVLAEQMDVKEELPYDWTPSFTAKFIKERYGGDPFTVIAFIGKDETNGFIVLEITRKSFQPPLQTVYDQYGTILLIGMILIILLFITVSFLFFRSIRKRLLQLQEAMAIRDVDGLPIQIDVKKMDEIGQLEKTFNEMVLELRESKQREQEEEQLRRELIANLSHDLRTPLTKLRAQTYSLGRETLTQQGKQAVKALETSIVDTDRLIDNLMSYTLLMASKYKLDRKEIDVVRYVRESLASWYHLFEKEEFDIEVELHPFKNNKWKIDPIWLGRIIDNLLQNVLRHAKNGKYIGVKTESTDEYDAFVFIDRGKGMKNESIERGVGIGLSIVDMMVKGMKLDWDIESSEKGTTIKIKRYR
ncbi:sensor histidine kinase [Oceanobacillus saliphilus]|uniref:sensor histidine kinase n=1 Tax=Oceanobacillus saliphilus TaxID=2925834 RepID=UPI00201D3158|nr:HAMP domain-containing sensor histidine kinase [Oceanobacillus saliphilus]